MSGDFNSFLSDCAGLRSGASLTSGLQKLGHRRRLQRTGPPNQCILFWNHGPVVLWSSIKSDKNFCGNVLGD